MHVTCSVGIQQTRASIEDPDQPVHLYSLIRAFDGLSMASQGSNVSSFINRFFYTCRSKYLKRTYIGLVMQKFERKIVIIFLPNNLNICFVCSKEPSH